MRRTGSQEGYPGLARSRESVAQWIHSGPENKCDPRGKRKSPNEAQTLPILRRHPHQDPTPQRNAGLPPTPIRLLQGMSKLPRLRPVRRQTHIRRRRLESTRFRSRSNKCYGFGLLTKKRNADVGGGAVAQQLFLLARRGQHNERCSYPAASASSNCCDIHDTSASLQWTGAIPS